MCATNFYSHFSLLFVGTTLLGSCNSIIVVCAELKKHDIGHVRGTPWQLLHSRRMCNYCFMSMNNLYPCTSMHIRRPAIIVVEGVEMEWLHVEGIGEWHGDSLFHETVQNLHVHVGCNHFP